MTKNDFCILFCSSDCHHYYDEQKLDSEDQKKIKVAPKYASQKDWRSSRYLKQSVPFEYQSLSLTHKKAHAALISATSIHAPIGIDIEFCQDRDFLALAQICYTEIEQAWLQQQPCLNTAFYQLWTLKEALIKAHHGQLADMAQWPLIHDLKTGIQIPDTNTPLQAYSGKISTHWLVSFVYPRAFPVLSQNHYKGLGLWAAEKPLWQAWPNLDNV